MAVKIALVALLRCCQVARRRRIGERKCSTHCIFPWYVKSAVGLIIVERQCMVSVRTREKGVAVSERYVV